MPVAVVGDPDQRPALEASSHGGSPGGHLGMAWPQAGHVKDGPGRLCQEGSDLSPCGPAACERLLRRNYAGSCLVTVSQGGHRDSPLRCHGKTDTSQCCSHSLGAAPGRLPPRAWGRASGGDAGEMECWRGAWDPGAPRGGCSGLVLLRRAGGTSGRASRGRDACRVSGSTRAPGQEVRPPWPRGGAGRVGLGVPGGLSGVLHPRAT